MSANDGFHQAAARALDTVLNPSGEKRNGFVLLTFEFGKVEGGQVNYVSNADRADMLVAVKEWLARAEGRYGKGGAV